MMRIPVAVLGSTGMVGQRLVAKLVGHPWFELAEVAGSERSAGRLYAEAVSWRVAGDSPPGAAALELRAPDAVFTSPLIFSAVDASTAARLEPLHALRGHFVMSNASAFRLDPEVPLVIPEVNPEALELIRGQRFAALGGGIVTNPNCTAAGLTLALAPLMAEFGIEAVTVATLQALSGAGYPGVASLDATANVVPHIAGEEDKIAAEPCRILGTSFPISVAVHRVPVLEGHTAAVFVKLAREASIDDVRRAMAAYCGKPEALGLPSAPPRPLAVLDGIDRPQPRLDVERGGGMTVSVGRLRADPVYNLRFTLLVNNMLRGAAGSALLNAELLAATGRLCGAARP